MEDWRWLIEVLGYVGMALVILSFTMKKVRWLRLINFIGSVLSCIYGFLTNTLPTAFLNLALACINISFPIAYYVKLRKNSKKEEKNDPN